MSKSIRIPNTHKPNFVVEIGNKKYSYPANTTQTVPDEVASVVNNASSLEPQTADIPVQKTEEWKFTLVDGTEIVKRVVVEE